MVCSGYSGTHYLQHGRNAAFTCRHFGISRQTFYRWWRRYNRHDLLTLESGSHRPYHRRQPTWSAPLQQAVLALQAAARLWNWASWRGSSRSLRIEVRESSRPAP
ncbi:MAG: helix-turn-helix domain-containing protein [Acidobacteria bacterium]|nr:helix-turn-helix domain-containing protein [Acidobacteriota bacterium]